MLTRDLEKDFLDLGLEIHYFKINWYNDSVDPIYHLKYHEDTLAFVVVSIPDWFERTFLPFLANKIDPSQLDSSLVYKDPIDQCMIQCFNDLAKKISSTLNTDVDKIHDFELLMPFRRPKILLQAAAHISGAAYFYKTQKNSAKRGLGVCIHPEYGGWFGLRGVFILKDILMPTLKRKPPLNTIPNEEDQEKLLKLFNENWRDGSYRDFIPVKNRYSPIQFEYFSLEPKNRIQFIKETIYPILDELIHHQKLLPESSSSHKGHNIINGNSSDNVDDDINSNNNCLKLTV